MKKVLLTLAGVFIIGLIYAQEEAEKLENILNRLKEIKTASYYSKSSSSAPGDTLAFRTHERFVNMFLDTTDKYLGAKYSTSRVDNHNELDMCYDGIYCVQFDWTNKSVQIDTLTGNAHSRPMAEFFMKVKSLVEYTKANLESTSMDLKFYESQDSIQVEIEFKNKLVEFMWLEPVVKYSEGKISRYELVLDNEYLPYKFVRKMPHQTSWETCTNLQISNEVDFEFSSIQQIPADFKIRGREREKAKTFELEGTTAPDWRLKEIYGDSISLSEIKHKVILIEFTGIGCGPCHASIPFLKNLADHYKGKSFELVCIETWSDNIAGIERYKSKNGLNYRFLVSKNVVRDKYKIFGVPSFFILDDKRMIKKVIVGYQKGATDKEILNIIDDML